MLIRKVFKKKQTCVANDLIQEVNLMDTRKNNLKGEIVFGYCRGHDTILILFLVWKILWTTRTFTFKKLLFSMIMGCCFSSVSKIKITDQTPKGNEFEYLRPKGRITILLIKCMMYLSVNLILTVGSKLVFVFGLEIKRQGQVFYC